MKNTKNIPLAGIVWKVAFNTLRSNPVILLPFALSGVLKLICLSVISLSIFYPLSIVFAPIIKTLWGEMFLHYPFNFSLMPRLFYYAQMAVYVFVESLLSGIAIWMVYNANEGKKPKFTEALRKALPKYLTLTALLLSVFLLVYLMQAGERWIIFKLSGLKAIALLIKSGMLDFLLVFVNFFIILLIEMVFAFSMPFVVLEDSRFFKAISGSVSLVKRFFLATFTLIFVPTVISLPLSLLMAGREALIEKTLPEITLLVLGLSVILTVFIDCIVTVSLALLFLSKKEIASQSLH